MTAQESLIGQVESVLASKDLSKRGEVLRRVTDLFIYGSGGFSQQQIDLFDEVMSARPQARTPATPHGQLDCRSFGASG